LCTSGSSMAWRPNSDTKGMYTIMEERDEGRSWGGGRERARTREAKGGSDIKQAEAKFLYFPFQFIRVRGRKGEVICDLAGAQTCTCVRIRGKASYARQSVRPTAAQPPERRRFTATQQRGQSLPFPYSTGQNALLRPL
jgi:hypothetical protein